MIEFRNNLDPQLKGIILGGMIGILSGLFSAYYTSNRNRKQQKYFKLQQIGEEIIDAIWKWQDTYILYDGEKENLSLQGDLLKGNCGYGEQKDEEKHRENYNKSSKRLDKLGEMKQLFHNTIFSKIQVYFSEPGLSKVRDQSIILSRLIAELSLKENEKNREEIEVEIRNICNKLKNTIIIRTMRYGRPFYKNFRYHRTNKYENH